MIAPDAKPVDKPNVTEFVVVAEMSAVAARLLSDSVHCRVVPTGTELGKFTVQEVTKVPVNMTVPLV